ncbi:hypothetical protein E1B28_009113 [Marasmius oreades]|uniref:Cupredoxin n=1 Tax=Marasmius oreades TaxID=181124 RepID=A0A9P7UUZ4_9AGAR|nr:uncharacterized protein E1B28_009113 [Marasmius oreades]KAG7092794.1 hypothetical protein E1B28_009113 [Marasmius oreades]
MIYRLSALALASLPLTVLAANIPVTVGSDNKLAFSPEFVTANQGDTVTFTFVSKNHTATQSTFDNPCLRAENGFDSGFRPVSPNTTAEPFVVTVGDTKPTWFYCKQKNPSPHCSQGMVFAINPPPEGDPHSFSAFKALAMSNATGPSSASSATATFTTPPPQTWATATATVTNGTSVWTSTYTSYEGSPQPTFAPQPVIHKIAVGANGKLGFEPSNISASLGDTVVFEFHPKAHGVTQSSFSKPCEPLSNGFASGFKPVTSEDADKPIFTIAVNDTAPIWAYCPQTNPKSHCGEGMVFSVNAVESGQNNFENFQKLAKLTATTNNTNTTQGGGSGGSGGSNSAVSSVQIGFSMTLVAMTVGFVLFM